jgi:hypothetical protein
MKKHGPGKRKRCETLIKRKEEVKEQENMDSNEGKENMM